MLLKKKYKNEKKKYVFIVFFGLNIEKGVRE
jgi:hypothetical protein